MNFYIIIPVYNEAKYIQHTIESLINQTHTPKHLVIINDNSTDSTLEIITNYANQYHWISSITIESSNEHIPGSKVVNAFYKGYETLDEDYDIICKFDGDLIFPENYLATISNLFKSDTSIGIAGGLPYIKVNDSWAFEKVASKNHVRGPIKAYTKSCFKKIGGLKSSIGWDTVDVLLAQFHGFKVKTSKSLHVKHLKPTGNSYSIKSKYLQGEAMYKMRYGFFITLISALKLAYKKRRFSLIKDYLVGFFNAKKQKMVFLVSEQEGQFIRKLRWNGMINKKGSK